MATEIGHNHFMLSAVQIVTP